MRLFFHVSATSNVLPFFDRHFKPGCFQRLEIDQLQTLYFVASASQLKMGDHTVEEFADQFLNEFESTFGNAASQKAKIRRLNLLFNIVDHSLVNPIALTQEIANALFVRGFYNVEAKTLKRPHSPATHVYYEFNEDKTQFTSYRGTEAINHAFFEQQLFRIGLLKQLDQQYNETEIAFERDYHNRNRILVRKDIQAADKELISLILEKNSSLDAVLNDPSNPQLKPYGACSEQVRFDLCIYLHEVYKLRQTLINEHTVLQNSIFAFFNAKDRAVKSVKITELTSLLRSNDLETLKKNAEQCGWIARMGWNSRVSHLLTNINKIQNTP